MSDLIYITVCQKQHLQRSTIRKSHWATVGQATVFKETTLHCCAKKNTTINSQCLRRKAAVKLAYIKTSCFQNSAIVAKNAIVTIVTRQQFRLQSTFSYPLGHFKLKNMPASSNSHRVYRHSRCSRDIFPGYH